ncbi:hypothetical protein HGRIS_010432 [Hohenbuehelia grisea]
MAPPRASPAPGAVHRVKFRAVDVWRDFVKQRWNPETRFLNLESMADDEMVKKHDIPTPGRGGTAREAAVIFKLASQLEPEVQTISLAKNNLTGSHLSTLAHYLPRLANLSLQDNRIRSYKELDFFATRKGKLEFLRELILLGNPLRETEVTARGLEHYKSEVSRKFSSLEMLDSEPIVQIAFDVGNPSTSASATAPPPPTAKTFPCDMQPSFITGVDGSIVSNFLMKFFTAFDSQREALANAYDPAGTFSFCINTSIPTRARLQGLNISLPNQRRLDWGPWIDGGSRNLNRPLSLGKMVSQLHIGGEDVVKSMSKLPKTRHDIGGPPEKFCVDSFPVPHGDGMGLLLVVHGEFAELPSNGLRSFDRSFMLAPAADGSLAKVNGWDVVILSDQWVIRAYSSSQAWTPGPMKLQADERPKRNNNASAAKTDFVLPPAQKELLSSVSEFQRPLVLQICQRTGLNVKWAVDCLTGNEWDVERAVANFNQVKATLAPEAFL